MAFLVHLKASSKVDEEHYELHVIRYVIVCVREACAEGVNVSVITCEVERGFVCVEFATCLGFGCSITG